ncbi:MAG: Tol-Pal system beta propeller repeat protein TolB [Lautropia sp.]
MSKLLFRLTFFAFASVLSGVAPAQQMRIDVTGVGANQVPLAIANFGGQAKTQPAVDSVIRSDLARSGMFRIIDINDALTETSTLDLGSFRTKGADSALVGSVNKASSGRFDVRYKLVDSVRQSVLVEESLLAAEGDARLAGHRIADSVYEKLTGIKGIFSTRIAFVTKQGNRFKLNIADWDGQNVQTALNSGEPIISPTWSPDGTRLAYVSFEARKPVVYVHSLASGQRKAVAEFRGSNSAPAWSPDGTQLAVTLTRDGGSQIYLISSNGGESKRLTQSSGIDTEPVFAPDGSAIYFTSDRGGSPQIYRMIIADGTISRVTFGSTYNVSPRISPDGRQLAYVTRRDGKFFVAIKDVTTGVESMLTDTGREESPSFAPNGRWVMYSTQTGSGEYLMAVTVDGRIKQRLTSNSGDIREPAWGPYPK